MFFQTRRWIKINETLQQKSVHRNVLRHVNALFNLWLRLFFMAIIKCCAQAEVHFMFGSFHGVKSRVESHFRYIEKYRRPDRSVHICLNEQPTKSFLYFLHLLKSNSGSQRSGSLSQAVIEQDPGLVQGHHRTRPQFKCTKYCAHIKSWFQD